ncbi:MAG: dihydroorotase [Firmicutes bacterium]|nr:dihydroorotase [Bacillota bacterium]
MRYCIKGGEIVDPAGGFSGSGDLLIEDGKVTAVERELEVEDCQVYDASGKLVFPGLIDLHVHLREPGREDEETIAGGAKAAIKGGFTGIACMANTDPVADNAVVIEYIKKQAQAAGYAKVYPIGAITKGLQGRELAEMGAMAAAGAVGFSDDGKTVTNAAVFREALEYATQFGLPLFLHEEDPDLAGDGVMHEGYWSTVLGLPGIPSVAEEIMIARDILLAEYTGARVHFCHVSAAGSVRLIREAKFRGLLISAEVTPHHFSLSDAMVQSYDPVFRVSPPLRGERDLAALKEGLRDGAIDVIATDHAPHTLEEKHREFSLAPTGMIGLETALSVAWTELVLEKILTKQQLVEKMSVNPAAVLGISGGSLKTGAAADVIVFDPNLEWTVTPEQLVSKSKNSPFIGRKLMGGVDGVWVNGDLKLAHGNFVE